LVSTPPPRVLTMIGEVRDECQGRAEAEDLGLSRSRGTDQVLSAELPEAVQRRRYPRT